MMKWKCYICNSDMEEKTISTTAGWGKYTLTIDGVKAYVCPECNETIYSAEEVHMLQELGKSLSVLNENKSRPEAAQAHQYYIKERKERQWEIQL